MNREQVFTWFCFSLFSVPNHPNAKYIVAAQLILLTKVVHKLIHSNNEESKSVGKFMSINNDVNPKRLDYASLLFTDVFAIPITRLST